MAEINDHPTTATPIVIATTGGTYSVSGIDNLPYRKDPGETGNMGSSASGPDGSAWWRYKPLTSGTLALSGANVTAGTGGNTDAEMWSYSGPADAGWEQELTLVTNAGGDSLAGNRPAHSFAVTAGTTYYVRMFAWVGARMFYALTATGPASDVYPVRNAAGSLLATAIPVYLASGATYVSPVRLDNRTLGEEIGEILANPDLQRTAWWTYRPSASGSAIFDSFASINPTTPTSTPKTGNPDTAIGVYRASGASPVMSGLTLLATQEDSLTGTTGLPGEFRGGQVTVAVTAGLTYVVQIGAWQGNHTLYGLRLTGPVASPPVVGLQNVARTGTLQIKHPDGTWRTPTPVALS